MFTDDEVGRKLTNNGECSSELFRDDDNIPNNNTKNQFSGVFCSDPSGRGSEQNHHSILGFATQMTPHSLRHLSVFLLRAA